MIVQQQRPHDWSSLQMTKNAAKRRRRRRCLKMENDDVETIITVSSHEIEISKAAALEVMGKVGEVTLHKKGNRSVFLLLIPRLFSSLVSSPETRKDGWCFSLYLCLAFS